MAITKYLPSKPFSSGTEYEVFKYNYCNRCKKHKEREDGFPAFPEDGGCPIEDAMEFARFDRERFPGDKIRKLIDSDGDVAKWHHCMEFETWQVNKMSELKRCPICNEEVKLMFLNCETFEDSVWDESIGNVPTWFKCYGCDSEFFHDEPIDTPEKQIEWWNNRKPLERITERLEEEREESATDYYDWEDISYLREKEAYQKAIEIVKEEGGMNEN